MTQNTSPTGHARLSPSSAHRWIACPASLTMCEQNPQTGSSHYADEGTAAHELAAKTLLTDAKIAEAFLGQRSEEVPQFVFDEDMCANVQKYVDDIMQYAEGHELMVEQRVNFSAAVGVENSFGTSDAIVLTRDGLELQLHDLKYGRGVRVEAERNEQLMTYALGALNEYDPAGLVEVVRLVIHQPRLYALSEWDCKVDELLEFGVKLRNAGKKAIEFATVGGTPPKEGFNPGEKQCRFCSAQAVCPALAKHNTELIIDEFVDLTEETAEGLGEKVEQAIERLHGEDNNTLAVLLKNVDLIESWCKAVRTRASEELQNGREVPGFKLVQGKQGNRKWADETEAEEVMRSMRLKREDMYSFKLVSPTQAEKLLKDSPRRWNRVNKLITRAEGGVHVAPESDKRPAIVIEPVVESFGDLSEGDVEDLV